MNLEEFLEENSIKNLSSIAFVHDDTATPLEDIRTTDNPQNYINIINEAENLKTIYIEKNESQEYYDGLNEFIKNASNNIQIVQDMTSINRKGYLDGEKIIEEIVKEVNPEWTPIQKLAFLHHKMGKIVSYSADFNFRGKYLDKANDTRNIWKVAKTCEGVCNGIVDLQRNIMTRLGIKTQKLSSKTHAFLLTETEKGNIITDPTWDLECSLYDAYPHYFGLTYDELQEKDGPIRNPHKLEKKPENVVKISEKDLRDIFNSVGLTNPDKTFNAPIYKEALKLKDKNGLTQEERTDRLLNIVTEKFPMESSHLSEVRMVLESTLRTIGIDSKEIQTKFIYDKNDKDTEKPMLMININNRDFKQTARILDIENMKFKSTDLKTVDQNYKVHNDDTIEPFWKKLIKEQEENIKDTNKLHQENVHEEQER